MKPIELIHMKEDFIRISQLMCRGIQTNLDTQKQYFTGYSYNTLYDWDQYFEAIPQIYFGWDTEYIKNGVTIFLDYQHEDGYIMRKIPGEGTKDLRLSPNPMIRYFTEQEDQEMLKPFLSQISFMVYKEILDLSWITPEYYEKLKKYLQYWLVKMDQNNNGLSTWRSGPHSEMDDQIERVGGGSLCFGRC